MQVNKDKYPIEVQNLLAKLLASENITVQHSHTNKTAAFDLKTRTLHMPVWKDCSKDVVSLLIGHEVGHALWTPLEAWEKKVKQNPKLKSIINIVEDARIEKMIKTKFPGLRKNFHEGYQELFESNFFGTKTGKGQNFLDRLNFNSKLVASNVNVKVDFTPEESELVNKVEKCFTFQDTCTLAEEIFSFIKDKDSNDDQNQDQTPEDNKENGEKEEEEKEESESDSNDDSDSNENETESGFDDSDSESDSEKDQEDDSETGSEDDQEESEESESATDNSKKGSLDDSEDPFESKTQNNFDNQKEQLTTSDYGSYGNRPIRYINLNGIDTGKFIVDYKKVQSGLTKAFRTGVGEYDSYKGITKKAERILKNQEVLRKFKATNDKTVSYMLKEFEMKKSAALHLREQTSRTGVINTNKIHSYKYNDDIFKKMKTLPKGQNHGLVMFIDMSGSMQTNYSGTVEQLITLTTFCRKAQIPFEVFGFTNHKYADDRSYDGEMTALTEAAPVRGDIMIDRNFRLRNYFSSKMNAGEFQEALYNLMYVANCYRNNVDGDHAFSYDLPSTERLSQTPLDEAILIASKIITDFKDANKLDIVNAVFLTDGGANGYLGSYEYSPSNYHDKYGCISPRSRGEKIIINDRKNKIMIEVETRESLTKAFLNHLKRISGVKVLGFYIYSSKYDLSYSLRDAGISEREAEILIKQTKKDKCCTCENPTNGYDEYYLISGSQDLSFLDENGFDDLTFDSNATKAKIRSSFSKVLKSKTTNRVILSKFIEAIA